METNYYICENCGNIVEFVKDSGVPVMCCGRKMTKIIPNTVEAVIEKHISVYEVKDGKIQVQIGSAQHPMLPEHYIEWIAIQTTHGCQRKELKPGDEPKACFALCGEEKLKAVYAYCNIHGLWKAEN